MTRLWRCSLLACWLAGCSACGSSPAAPVIVTTTTTTTTTIPLAAATLASVGQLSLPGCDGLIQLARSVGLATANCKQFTGLLVNNGLGCASNVRGTTVIFTDAAGASQISAAGWSYVGVVKPGEQIAYTGGALSIPTAAWFWRTTPAWDNVRCQ